MSSAAGCGSVAFVISQRQALAEGECRCACRAIVVATGSWLLGGMVWYGAGSTQAQTTTMGDDDDDAQTTDGLQRACKWRRGKQPKSERCERILIVTAGTLRQSGRDGERWRMCDLCPGVVCDEAQR